MWKKRILRRGKTILIQTKQQKILWDRLAPTPGPPISKRRGGASVLMYCLTPQEREAQEREALASVRPQSGDQELNVDDL